jgi:hypothetical protein
MLVPNPKNAFQSPAVHRAGRFISDAVAVIICSYRSETRFQSSSARSRAAGEARHPDLGIAEVH